MTSNIFRPIKLGKEIFHPKSFDEHSFVMEWTLDRNGKVPEHVHHYMDEHFKITHGEFCFKVNGDTILKKAGEELFVPKGTIHSVKNVINGNSNAIVTYSPCADTHRMFQMLSVMDKEQPDSMINMLKYFYLFPRLGLKEFSSIRPVYLISISTLVITLIGKLSGWNKLIVRFKN